MAKDTEDPLAHNPYSFQKVKGGQVRIFHFNTLAKTIRGSHAVKFLSKIEFADEHSAQLIMAKETGQFKFGNERS